MEGATFVANPLSMARFLRRQCALRRVTFDMVLLHMGVVERLAMLPGIQELGVQVKEGDERKLDELRKGLLLQGGMQIEDTTDFVGYVWDDSRWLRSFVC